MARLVMILFVFVVLAVQQASGYEVVEFPVCMNSADQERPDISGSIVVWTDMRNGNRDIYSYNFLTQAETAICTEDAGQYNPAIDGDIVVWVDDRSGVSSPEDLYAYDLSTGIQFIVCDFTANQAAPAIDGNIVVWSDERGGVWKIYGKDLRTGEEIPIETTYRAMEPDISGNVCVFWRQDGGDQDIYGYNIETREGFPIAVEPNTQEEPAIDGNIIVWKDGRVTGNSEVYGYDLDTEHEFQISFADGTQRHPAISGNLVVWQDNRSGNWDIYGYDLATETEFPVCVRSGNQEHPRISGNIVVWQDDRNGNLDVYGAYIYNSDKCITALPIQINSPYEGSTIEATGLSTSSCGYKDTLDVWHSFTAEVTGQYTISLCGSTFDTTLAVFDECEGTELACNDDTPEGVCSHTVLSQLEMKMERGETYYIRVAGHNGQTGEYTLTVAGPVCTAPIRGDMNDDCKIDFLDLADILSRWLECNLEPEELCWQ